MSDPFTIPPYSEPFLKSQPPSARLAVIIDLLLGKGAGQNTSNVFYTALAAANQDSVIDIAAPAQLLGYDMVNVAASVRYVKFYDQAAAPTSADIPVRVVAIGPGQSISRSALLFNFATKLSTRITTGYANNDAGAATAGDVTFSLDYKLL